LAASPANQSFEALFAKLKTMMLPPTTSPPYWLWALNIEMAAVFLVTPAVRPRFSPFNSGIFGIGPASATDHLSLLSVRV
jgi:hypothetical protein